MRKKYVVRWELAGKRVASNTPGATSRREFVCWVQKIDGRDITLGKIKETAKLILVEKTREYELKRRGILPEVAASTAPLSEAIEEYLASLEAREASEKHLFEIRQKLERVARESDWVRVSDATLESLEAWISKARRADVPGTSTRFSIMTGNHYRAAWRAFGNWLVRTNRAILSPFRAVQKLNSATGRRLVRRALTVDECGLLLDCVVRMKPRAAMSGTERAMLYRVALSTGFRAKECSSLTPESFRLDDEVPVAIVEAAASKARRRDEQPLPKALVEPLRAFLRGRPRRTQIWPAADPARNKMGKCLRADCAEALRMHGNAPAGFLESRPGAQIDFHALRGTFLTALAPCMSASSLGALGRHASVETTERHYVRHKLAALSAALEGAHVGESWFPNGSPDERNSMQRKGTQVARALALVERFIIRLKPLQQQEFTVQLASILEARLLATRGVN